MHILLSLIVMSAPVFAEQSKACVEDLAARAEAQSELISTHLLQFGQLAWRAAIAREFSSERGLTTPLPGDFRSAHFASEHLVTKPEAMFNEDERAEFLSLLKAPHALPREWRVRATRAFLDAIELKATSPNPNMAADVHERLIDRTAGMTEHVIEAFVPDADAKDLKRLKR